jgi:hypothetical protein
LRHCFFEIAHYRNRTPIKAAIKKHKTMTPNAPNNCIAVDLFFPFCTTKPRSTGTKRAANKCDKNPCRIPARNAEKKKTAV